MDQQRVDVGRRRSPRGRRRPPRRSRLARPPRARALVEDLDRAAAALHAALDRVGGAAGGGDVGTDQHRIWTLALLACCVQHARALRSLADRRPAHRRRADGTVQLAPGARPRRATFVLRIEDTDRERSTPENVEQIFEALRWLELDWDGEPVFQSERADRHAEVVAAAARRRATPTARPPAPTRSRPSRSAHGNRGFRGEDEGDGRGAPARARRGRDRRPRRHPRRERVRERACMDDLVIARADGTPVYHLAVVVDDLDAGITHVVRGADHYSNTPKQMLILQAMGAPTRRSTPTCRCCTGPTARSSPSATAPRPCRSCATRGYLPEAVRNYLALLGWGYDEETDVLSPPRSSSERFSLERVSKSPGRVRRAEAALDERPLPARARRRRPDGAAGGPHRPRAGCATRSRSRRRRSRRWPSSGRWRGFFFDGPVDDPDGAREDRSASPRRASALAQARAALGRRCRSRGPRRAWRRALRGRGRASRASSRKQVFQPLRVALAGTTVSPGIFETVALLGRDETLAGSMRRRATALSDATGPALNRPSTRCRYGLKAASRCPLQNPPDPPLTTDRRAS